MQLAGTQQIRRQSRSGTRVTTLSQNALQTALLFLLISLFWGFVVYVALATALS